jgi:hypothetical protein
VVEFDNENITVDAFKILSGSTINSSLTDYDNFNWRASKPFILNEKHQELDIRISEKEVNNNLKKGFE